MQSYNLIYSKFIRIDIDVAYDYIIEEYKNQIVANNLLNNILKKVEDIAESPYTWALLDDEYLAAKGFRSVIINKYRLFYVVDVDNRNVQLIRFLHCRRDWVTILKNDLIN